MEASPIPTSTLNYAPPAVATNATSPDAPAVRALPGEWRNWWLLMLALLVFFGLLWNPHWVPGGDSDFYIAVARNLALGRGHTWNGTPVAISPPGWPLVLAAAMKLSPSFGFLKLVTLVTMTGFLGISYWILRRFTSPGQSALIVLITACISHVYSLTFWLHSDALFCLVCAAAVLFALQIGEGRPIGWRMPVLLACCAASVAVRWLGVANWLVVAGALLHGRLPFKWGQAWTEVRRFDRRWMAFFLTAVVSIGTFWGIRAAIASSKANEVEQREAVAEEAQSYDFVPTPEVGRRRRNKVDVASKKLLAAGKWFSWLYWQPFRFGSGYVPLDIISGAIGWLVAGVGALAMVRGIRRREWIWLGLGVYCAALCFGWPNPNARYLVPLLPLLILGTLEGLATLSPPGSAPWRHRAAGMLANVFIVSIALCNIPLWGVEVWVARSNDFYAHYEDGLNQGLIAAGHYLGQLPVDDNEVGVSGKYVNLNRWRFSHYGLRVIVLLTDRIVREVDGKLCVEPHVTNEDDGRLYRWTSNRNVHYYVFQPEVNPWRVWHFRVPAWLQERLMRGTPHEPIGVETGQWQLWKMARHPTRIELPNVPDWPDRVPGM